MNDLAPVLTFFLNYFILVNVKWGKQKFESVEVNTDEAPEVFQAQMFALSSVPPERQKIMAKGKALKVHI